MSQGWGAEQRWVLCFGAGEMCGETLLARTPTHLQSAEGPDPTNGFPPTNASGPQAVRGIPRGTPGLIPLCTLQEWADVCCRGLRSVHAYILVYDICCFDSFEYIKTIRQQILETR